MLTLSVVVATSPSSVIVAESTVTDQGNGTFRIVTVTASPMSTCGSRKVPAPTLAWITRVSSGSSTSSASAAIVKLSSVSPACQGTG